MVWIRIIVAFVDLTGYCHKSNRNVLITAVENDLKAMIIQLRHRQKNFVPHLVDSGLESFGDFRCHFRFEIRLARSVHHD